MEVVFETTWKPGFIITNHPSECSWSCSPDCSIFSRFECNTTSYWLNHKVYPIKVVLHSKFTNSWRKRQRMFLRMVGKYILRALSVFTLQRQTQLFEPHFVCFLQMHSIWTVFVVEYSVTFTDCVTLGLTSNVLYQIYMTLPNHKILDRSKAFADNKVKLAILMIFVFDRVENIVGKKRKY